MLTTLSIKDIVIIERLELELCQGLTVFTGETGAGKSILLDALGLVLGYRGDSSLVRSGCDQGVVTAEFHLQDTHPVFNILIENGLDEGDQLVIRRIQYCDGRSRALVNDNVAGVGLLKQIGAMLVEIHAQHDNRAFFDISTHRGLLDAYGDLSDHCVELARRWYDLQTLRKKLKEYKDREAQDVADYEYFCHALEELELLDPIAGEEDELAEKRQLLMNSEKIVSELEETIEAISGADTLYARLNSALKRLGRHVGQDGGVLERPLAAIDKSLVELEEVIEEVKEAQYSLDFDPVSLEQVEERLFAIRAAGRKYKVHTDKLPSLLKEMQEKVNSYANNGNIIKKLEDDCLNKENEYITTAKKLSEARKETALKLSGSVMVELKSLKLAKVIFSVSVVTDDFSKAGPDGLDRIEFVVATNPGSDPGPLTKVASGGELARIILALKVVLAKKSTIPTLIFDEIDIGIGGAVAEAIGNRLSLLAKNAQLLAVTHSPQVAARADSHVLISKSEYNRGQKVLTNLQKLNNETRQEEIARMLSGAVITNEARAAAGKLINRVDD